MTIILKKETFKTLQGIEPLRRHHPKKMFYHEDTRERVRFACDGEFRKRKDMPLRFCLDFQTERMCMYSEEKREDMP